MSYFKNATVTGAELFQAAREVCSRLYVANGGHPQDAWRIEPHPSTAAIRKEYTYGGTVWVLHMPAIPMDARLTRNEADTLLAYVTHELGHALFTDFTEWQRAVREGVHNLTNALEDVREELKLCTLGAGLPNAGDQLAILTEYCTAKALAQGWNPTRPESLAFTIYSYAATHADVLGYKVPSMPEFSTICPPSQIAFLESVMTRVKACNSTADCVNLALALRDELQDMRQAQPQDGETGPAPQEFPQRPSDDAEGEGETEAEGDAEFRTGGKGDDAEGESETEAEADGEGDAEGDDAEGEAESEKGEGDDAEADAEADGKGEGAGEGSTGDTPGESSADSKGGEGAGLGAWHDADDDTQTPVEPNLDDMGERIARRMGRDPEQVIRDNLDVLEFLNATPSVPRANTRLKGYGSGTTEYNARLLSTPAKLRRDITRAVRSPEQLDTEHYQTRGRFDARAFARVETGAENIFRRRSESMGQTAAVSLLIDLSQSMQGERIRTASCLALHLGDALRAAAVPFEIAGFICAGAVSSAHGLIMAKTFRDPWQGEARDRTGALSLAARGGTAMMPAIMAMSERLQRRSGVTRRILLVLTDGADGFTDGSVKASIAAAEARGVEVVGLGMLHDASHVFARHVPINDLSTVARDGLGALLDVLRN